MAARSATARLRFLERQNYGLSVRFTIEPHEQLEKLLLEWASLRLYGIHIEYDAIEAGKKTYTINSDGMWLLSHLFANWNEMDVPPRSTVYQCDQCRLYSHASTWRCPECEKMLCSQCATRHVHHTYKEQTCHRCGKPEGAPRFNRCSTCAHVFCTVCYASHLHTHDEDPFSFTAEEIKRFYEQLKWDRAYRESAHRQSWSSSSAGGTYTHTSASTSTRFIPVNVREALKVLGVPESNPTVEDITSRHKHLAKEQHPDLGGDTKTMAKINNARDVALKWAKEQQKT